MRIFKLYDMLINNYKTEIKIWLFFFFYATLVAVMVQLVIIPYVLPSINSRFGLINVLDGISFHDRAYALALKIKQEGWSAWELRPSVYKVGLSGVLAILYYFTVSKPWVLIPFSAMVHAFSGLIIYGIVNRLVGNIRIAFISALPFIFFPSAMLWYTQIHKDGFSIFGFYLILYAWVLFMDIETWRNAKRTIGAIIYAYIGMVTVWVIRPYINQIVLVLLLFILPLIIMRQIIWWRLSFLSFKRSAVAIIVTCCVILSFIPFSRGGIQERAISITAPGIMSIYSQSDKILRNKTVKTLLERRSLNAMYKLKSGYIDEEVLTVLRFPLYADMKKEVVRELKMVHREYLSKSKEGMELIKKIDSYCSNDIDDIKDMSKESIEKCLGNDTLKILDSYPETSFGGEGTIMLTSKPLIYYFKNDTSLYIDMLTVNIKENKTVEIKSKPFQKYLADQINNILESPLGKLGNINQIRVSPGWRRTPWIPVYIDAKLATIASFRWGYLSTGGLTNIDTDIAFSRAVDVIKYLPRALLIAFLAPFPDTWSIETTYMVSNIMRLASVGEMTLIYCAVLFLPYGLYRWRKDGPMWMVVYLNFSMLSVLGLTICNVGTLYRMRYGFLMMTAALGIAGLGAMILKIKGKKAS